MATQSRVVLIGDLEATRLLCALLTADGAQTIHLPSPDEASVRAAFAQHVDGVAVVVRGDVAALRYTLLAAHLQQAVPIVVTVFDRTIARQLTSVVPNCTVTSPADVAAPAVVAACIHPTALAILDVGGVPTAVLNEEGTAAARRWDPPQPSSLDRLSRWVPHRHGGAAGLLVTGLVGLVAIIATEWLLAVVVLHEGVLEAFYTTTRLAATVGPADATAHGAPGHYLVISALLMLMGIGFTGALVAGLVEWIVSARTAALVGPRSVPRRHHVVVAGLGQVGLRVGQLLHDVHVPCVIVERAAGAPNLPQARSSRLPVVIGDAADLLVLERVGLGRARAIAALASDDLDNVAVVISALAIAPEVRTVLRSGEDPAVEETTSLFRIGRVADVSALTAAWVCASIRGESPVVAYADARLVGVLSDSGDSRREIPPRCRC
ncbi:NAD-binding protein [Intrasporangium sp.]|uniref:NAD-binding protein n=1 Tax=Intrasporangium sp. TaxID=1925024 RepID=UPI00293B7E0A|nr:NAD-binding protein [Intrasporangium sp.]MDV3220801.1 NAD-binding protein [Intrasporangium sp.]